MVSKQQDTREKTQATRDRSGLAGEPHLSEAALGDIRALATRYPDRLAAVLPALYVAQGDLGFLSLNAMQEVAHALELPASHIYGVATFYTMFRKTPVGRFHFQVCTNLCCALRGGAQVFEKLKERLGIQQGEISTDGMWSIEEVECLGSCATSPCLQINQDAYEEVLDEDRLDAIITACKAQCTT